MKILHCLILSILLGLTLMLSASTPARADQEIDDDYIIISSLCVGEGCANGESFGHDVIILKQNDPWMTSRSTGSFLGCRLVNTSDRSPRAFAVVSAGSEAILFRIHAGAPTNALYVRSATGRVGLGSDSPGSVLHVEGGAYINEGMEVASSRALKEAVRTLEPEPCRKALMDLRPVRFRYRSDPSEETLGFIAEDVPSLVATGDRKTVNPTDFIAVMTRVVQEQRGRIQDLAARISELERGSGKAQ